MTILEIILLALSLAMDCFTVSIACGTITKQFNWRNIITIAFFFGLFQAAMPVIGWFLTKDFQQYIENVDHWIAFTLLAFIGGKMILESFKKEEEKNKFNPTSLKVILTLAVATSIDALAIGITFAMLSMDRISDISIPVAVIGLISFIMSIIGYSIGVLFGKRFKIKMELWGGLILLAIGFKILFEHLNIL